MDSPRCTLICFLVGRNICDICVCLPEFCSLCDLFSSSLRLRKWEVWLALWPREFLNCALRNVPLADKHALIQVPKQNTHIYMTEYKITAKDM